MSVRDLCENGLETPGLWVAAEGELLADARRMVEESGLVFDRIMPNMFRFGMVVRNPENTRWIQVQTDDARRNPAWIDSVRLRRMTGPRDWRDDSPFACVWERMGDAMIELMDPQYDPEAN